jgi:hypothetical protein
VPVFGLISGRTVDQLAQAIGRAVIQQGYRVIYREVGQMDVKMYVKK